MEDRENKQSDYWNNLFRTEDPWQYSSPYEQSKYDHTLEMVPTGPLAQCVELGCAEGIFTRQLAPRVGHLQAIDISSVALDRCRSRCASLANVSFECSDLLSWTSSNPVDLIVCSEVLYYIKDRHELRRFVERAADMTRPGGHFLTAHVNAVADDRTRTGFDFSEIGAGFISEVFASLPAWEFVRELRTPLYMVQLFRRRSGSTIQALPVHATVPHEVQEREAAPFEHTHLKRGGCVITDAESRFLFTTPQVPILMYHRIASDGPAQLRPYRLSAESFERQLQYLRRHGYHTVRAQDCWQLNAGLEPQPRRGRLVALTFDDGYLDFYETAWPMLRRYGFTATVYAVADHIGGFAEWDRHFGEPAPLMSEQQLKQLALSGVEIGAHSRTHRALSSLQTAHLDDEVGSSAVCLRASLGIPITGFCYPYCDVNSDVVEAARRAGYSYAVVGAEGPSQTASPKRYLLPRIEILGTDDFDTFVSKLPAAVLSDSSARECYEQLRFHRDRSTYFSN